MKHVERNPPYTNLLVDSPSPYLRSHAHNPVFWYPWGKDALDRAKAEDKPIFLSIGYSSCYWCHVMEREVFENVSIAAQMNASFINIKVDREEHPELDDIYMIARQLLKQEGGWPNNVFLTPGLKPFYAGGTYAADESDRRPSFPRLLEWISFVWNSQRDEVTRISEKLTQDMQNYLAYKTPENAVETNSAQQAEGLFQLYKKYYDARSGGFFQAPKFPHECYLQFLLGYYESTGNVESLDMVTHSLRKMAAGGIYDHVGCGFHRYAVDKEWYVPHFEKMLYNQAQLARTYTDAARLTGNPYFADIARSVLDFVSGPLTAPGGAFYSAIDAETDAVEGAHYAWSAKELEAVLTPEEMLFLTTFYALADIPQFPGHKHTDGQALIARKALDVMAQERGIPYLQIAALSAALMNKLLELRNTRKAPAIDDKILVGWNGLMIDALAHAGRVLGHPHYTQIARKALNFLLEHAIDNDGNLKRVYALGHAYLEATLDDYAFLIKGILSLHRATPDVELLAHAQSLAARARELFSGDAHGYIYAQVSGDVPFTLKSGDDSALPNSNAVMLHNLIDLHEMTNEGAYLDQAKALAEFFTAGNTTISVEWATMMHAVLRLTSPSPLVGEGGVGGIYPQSYIPQHPPLPNPPPQGGREVIVTASLFPADPQPGAVCEVMVTFEIKDGWHINANRPNQPFLIPTQIDVQGEGVELLDITYPTPLRRSNPEDQSVLLHYEGMVTFTARIRLPARRPPFKIAVRYQPCHGTTCHAVRDVVTEI